MYFCILQRYFSSDSKIPVLIVGNKADMNAVRQDYILQPEAFCAKHRVSSYCSQFVVVLNGCWRGTA